MNPNLRQRFARDLGLVTASLVVAMAGPAAAQPAPPGTLVAWGGYHQSVRLTWSGSALAGNDALRPASRAGAGLAGASSTGATARASITRAEWNALRAGAARNAATGGDRADEVAKSALTGGDTANMPAQAQDTGGGSLTYNIYRAPQPDGPFAMIAEGISSSWYRDDDVANEQSYAYRVTAVSDGQESEPSDVATATPTYGGWRIPSGYTSSTPSIDGFIGSDEWSDARVVDITAPYDPGLEPVLAYVMNSDTHLFVAVRDPNIPTPDEFNQIGIYYEQSARGRWNSIPAEPEGNVWIIYDSFWDETTNWFRAIRGDWPFITVTNYGPVGGVEQGLGFLSGYHEFEVAIDLSGVPLVSAPGRVIALALYSDKSGDPPFSGDWPGGIMQTVEYFAAPVLYGDVALAASPGVPVLLPESAGGASLAAFPNPARGAATFALTRAGAIERGASDSAVEIFDASGRRVAGVRNSPSGLWRWDGSGDDGAEAPQGVYFFRLETSGSNAAASSAAAEARAGRLTLLR